MLLYCLKIRKNTESKNSEVKKSRNRKIILLSRRALCGIKICEFIKEQEDFC